MQTVRMAEHTVSSTVVEKFINGMDEVRDILAKFGTSLLNREHVRKILCRNLEMYRNAYFLSINFNVLSELSK